MGNVIGIAVLTGFVFLWWFIPWKIRRSSMVLLEEEQGLPPVYTEQCGISFGMLRYTMPFVRVTVYPSLCVIRPCSDKMVLRPGDIVGLDASHRDGWGRIRLRIDPRRIDVNPDFVLLSRHTDQLQEALERHILASEKRGTEQ